MSQQPPPEGAVPPANGAPGAPPPGAPPPGAPAAAAPAAPPPAATAAAASAAQGRPGEPAGGRGAGRGTAVAGRGRGAGGAPLPAPPAQLAPGAAAAAAGPPARTAELAPAAKKARPAPPPKVEPLRAPQIKVSEQLHESQLYRKMVDLERKIDAHVERRKTEVRETLRAGDKAPRTVRLYAWNTVSPSAGAGEPASWTLHLHGKLLEAAPAPGQTPASAAAATSAVRVASLFRSVEVRLDEGLYPGPEGRMTWQRDAAGASGLTADGWEVKRPVRGGCGVATVTLQAAHAPDRHALPPPLARLLGTAAASRTGAVHALWARCRALGALGQEDPSEIRVDPPLAEALQLPAPPPGAPHTAKFAHLAERVVAQLAPPAPFTIRVPIRPDAGPRGAGADVYDIAVDLPDPRAAELNALVARHAKDQAAAEYDARIAVQLSKIAEHRRRRAFLLGFAAAPAPFLNALTAAQARELELTAGGAVHAREAERRADFYRLPWTDDAVMHYLQRRAGANVP